MDFNNLPVQFNVNIDTKDLSPVASQLLDKASQAIGTFCRPLTTVAQAIADTSTEIIKEHGKCHIADLHYRTQQRFYNEEIRKQQNRESILEQSILLLEETAKPNEIKNDWIFNFFDKAQHFENEDMQNLWAKILAGEANQPGSFSRKTINILEDISSKDALIFEQLCRCIWAFDQNVLKIVVFEPQLSILEPYGINFENLINLENLGLVVFNSSFFNLQSTFSDQATGTYGKYKYSFSDIHNNPLKLEIGNYLLTKAGEEVASIIKAEPIPNYAEYVTDFIMKKYPNIKIEKIVSIL